MRKILLLIASFCLLFVSLYGQKKHKATKALPAIRTINVGTVSRISAERSLRLTRREQAMKTLVVLKNDLQLLPLQRLDTLKILVVSIGIDGASPVHQLIDRYARADYLSFPSFAKLTSTRPDLKKATSYNLVILVIGEDRLKRNIPSGNGIPSETSSQGGVGQSLTEEENLLLESFLPGTKVVLMLFGSQRFLAHWSLPGRASSIVVSDSADYDKLDLSAQMIFGAIGANGKLSCDIANYSKGDGISFPAIDRLRYVLPEEMGIDSIKLSLKMDSLVEIGLKARAFPGCQLLLARDGKVFYEKSYGFHTYDRSSQPVRNDDLYDLASVTKVLAPVPALMMLVDQKKFVVTKKMSDYWPDWKGSNKEGVLISDLLSHQARLRPGVILWPKTVTGQGLYKPEYYATQPTPGYDLRVSKNLYLIDSYPDTVYKIIKDSPLLKSKKYAYSDLGFVILPKVIENLSGESYEKFLHTNLFDKLGASTLMYHPYLTEPIEKIVPTENDQNFRHEMLRGFVHDETAALMGGVSGNAGLFGSVGDVAKVMQLYLQNGEYGNERYISSETLKNWTSSHFQKTNNRRGFGFDKPGIQSSRYSGKERYPSPVVSEQSYGHSGYTGTFVWADPVSNLLFVFLSNRVFPDRDNHKINNLRLRPMLLETLFKLAGKSPSKR